MAGLYLHIPFCRQACVYCDFHFSTSLKYREPMVNAILREMELQKDFFKGETLQSLYFGGGTPSVLEHEEIVALVQRAFKTFRWAADPEITLEANPDDLSQEKLTQLKAAGINRLSIGVQSFRDSDLQFMNRSHNAEQSISCLQNARQAGFNNITLDLIYGLPNMDDEAWKDQVRQALNLGVPHISSYALTVEPRTALHHKIEKGEHPPLDEEQAARQFKILWEMLDKAGFEHYEVSNFARPGFRARHNSSYWQGRPYLGVGPSAHSFRAMHRYWNVSNNALYRKAIEKGELAQEYEELSEKDRFNEYLMTALRTREGLNLLEIEKTFAPEYSYYLMKEVEPVLRKGQLHLRDRRLFIPQEWRFHSDGIAASLFYI